MSCQVGAGTAPSKEETVVNAQETAASEQRDLFGRQAALYAKYRPRYPPELFSYLASLTSRHELCWDVGTGSGQAAVELARHFKQVIGTDLSAKQLEHAERRDNVTYAATPTTDEAVGQVLGDAVNGGVDLVTVAQALHWFDFDSFFPLVRRVLRPGGVCAAWMYALPTISPELDAATAAFYEKTLPFWAVERRYIEENYETIPFALDPLPGKESTGPFTFETPATMHLNFEEYVGFFSSWSPVSTAKSQGVELLDEETVSGFRAAWGDGAAVRPVEYKIVLRIGRNARA